MTDSILIVGAGVAGLHAALECASAGARAIVIERAPVAGGRLAAAMTRAEGIGGRAEGLGIPLFETLTQNENIELLTNTTVEEIQGRPGNFTVTLCERARFVTDACTRCKLCHTACPVVRPNEYDAGLTFRKAIFTPMAETLPAPYVIDIDSCLNTPPNYLPCNRCVEVCEDRAIFFDMPLQERQERQVGAVILAPGFRVEDGAACAELGYGKHPDIVTTAELQRLLESPGPTGGYASRPSNEEYPDKVLLVVENLTAFALYIVASQVRQLLEQDVATVALLALAQPATEPVHAGLLQFAEDAGIEVRWGTMPKVDAGKDGCIDVSFEDLAAHRYAQDSYDMVVLCADVGPADDVGELAETAGIELASDGFLAVRETDGGPIATSRPGIFVAGCGSGAKNIRDSLCDARRAASAALAQLDSRLLKVEEPAAPPEEQPAVASPQDDPGLQQQIEKLLYALLDRTPS